MFVIFAILIVAGVFLVLYSQTDLFKKSESVNPEIAPIKSIIDNCLKHTGESALILIGQQGGYYHAPSLSVNNIVPYYFYMDSSKVPSETVLTSSISNYVDSNLQTCLNFSQFPDFSVSYKKSLTKTSLLADKVVIDTIILVDILKSDIKYSLSDFRAEIPSRLKGIYNVSSGIVDDQLKHMNSTCISCMSKAASDNGLVVYLGEIGSDVLVVQLRDYNISVQGGPYYEFDFAIKYNLI